MSEQTAIEKSLSKQDYEELAEFRYLLRKFLRFSEEEAWALGVTPQHHQALLAIHGYPGRDFVTIGELAERLQIKHNAAVGLVDRLVTDNLAERRHTGNDRRQVHVTLTQHGTDLLLKLSAVHREELQRSGPELFRQLERLVNVHRYQ